MNFKTFIEMHTLPTSGAADVIGVAPSTDINEAINDRFDAEFSKPIESSTSGLETIISVLEQYSIQMPVPDDLDSEDDEFVVELMDNLHLYVIYTQNDDGLYDFYAQVTDDEGLDEILEEDEIEE